MKAQVLHSYDESMQKNRWVSLENVPEPRIQGSTDVLVRIGGAGVCRTDLHVIEGALRHHVDPNSKLLPLVLGHENAGWVEEVGRDVEGFKKGDAVIVHPKISDAYCLDCRRGHDMHGPGPFPGINCNGGFAELVHTNARNMVKLPITLSPKEVAPYADAGLTAYSVVKKAARNLTPSDYCVVIGVGGLGYTAVQCLKAMCSAEIIAVDRAPGGLVLARDGGADHVVEANGGEVDEVLSITGGRGAQAVIDCVGDHGTTTSGLAMTRAAGTYYVVGYGEDIRVATGDLVRAEKSIVGNLVGTWAELTELMRLADRGLVKLITQYYPLQDADRALQDLHKGLIKGRAVLIP